MSAAETLDGIPPTPCFRFRPTQRELVEFYLLPRARGQDPFPGVIIEDDAAGSSLPWDLFERHGLGSEDEAYFLVRTIDAKKPGARQDRGCGGGIGSWKMQSSLEKGLRVGGEKIRCRKSNLNLHMGKGKNGGSVGWVMHEYTIAAPPCPSLVKICHIAFTGHGRKRKRVPDGCQNGQASQVEATAAGGSSWGMLDGDSGAVVYPSADEERSQLAHIQDISPKSPLLQSSEFLGFPSAASANAEQYQELEQEVPSTQEQQQSVSTSMGELLYEGELELWSSIGFDLEQYSDLWSSAGVDVQSSDLWSSTSNNVVPGIGDGGNMVRQLDSVQEDCQTRQVSQVVDAAAAGGCSGAMLDPDSGTVVDASADEECSQPVLTEDIFSQSPLLDSNDYLGFPSASSANADQYQELEQEVPTTEEQQAMMPQLMVQQSVNSLGEQHVLQSSNLGGNLWSPTEVDVQGSNDFAEQDFWSSTVVESDSVVPHISDMAEGHQDFWSSSGPHVQSNCAMLDMAAGAVVPANCHWGGHCITC